MKTVTYDETKWKLAPIFATTEQLVHAISDRHSVSTDQAKEHALTWRIMMDNAPECPDTQAAEISPVYLGLLAEANDMMEAFTSAEKLGAWREKVNKLMAGDIVDVAFPKLEHSGPMRTKAEFRHDLQQALATRFFHVLQQGMIDDPRVSQLVATCEQFVAMLFHDLFTDYVLMPINPNASYYAALSGSWGGAIVDATALKETYDRLIAFAKQDGEPE